MNPHLTPPLPQKKAVLVTGAAKRLGREIALQFAHQGWDVAVHYGRSQLEAEKAVAEIQGLGIRSSAFQADLTIENSVGSLFAESKLQPFFTLW